MLWTIALNAQIDKIVFDQYKPGFYENSILRDIQQNETPVNLPVFKRLTLDFSNNNYPTDTTLYKKVWYSPPVSQGNTGTCWCYAATSFFESEVFRQTGNVVKLSEMYTVYWEYVERAADFVRTRGETYFSEGSEANAVPKIWKKYGIVPYAAYPALVGNQKFHNHREMFDKMNNYLMHAKENNTWNEKKIVEGIKEILNTYMGMPPEVVVAENRKLTPLQYLSDELKINPGEYFSFMSNMEQTPFEMHELIEADNWWHASNYYNLPLNEYYKLILQSVENDYSVCICGDVSEPGIDSYVEVAVVPDFDIPSENISDESRQFRLSNGTTTDDHCIHIVGYYLSEDGVWFMVKDSGAGAFDGPNKGYRFMHEDYVKLKMMNILIHKNPAKPILDKIIK